MKKIEKRKYLTPETEVVRFTADIITTSPLDHENELDTDPGYSEPVGYDPNNF